MATTATTTSNQPVTYSLLVIFTVDPSTDEHLQDQESIRDEAESWLASLASVSRSQALGRRRRAGA
jgi:hypothetical protein